MREKLCACIIFAIWMNEIEFWILDILPLGENGILNMRFGVESK